MPMMTNRRFPMLVLVCLLVTAISEPSFAGGKSCGRCGAHKELKAVYRLVKICEPIEMPEYAHVKQEAFQPDKGVVRHEGYRCDTFHHIWRNCDCTLGCESHTICDCQKLLGAKSTGHHISCPVRQQIGVTKLTVPVLKWEVVHRCHDCRTLNHKGAKK